MDAPPEDAHDIPMMALCRFMCGILVAAPILLGNDATKAVKIEQLMTALNVEQQEIAAMTQARRMIAARIQAQLGARASDPDVAAKHKKVLALVEQRTSWHHLKPIVEKSYSDAFSEEEIDAILAFYRSPVGKQMLQKMPVVMQNVSQNLSAEITSLKPQIDQLLNPGSPSKH